MKDTFVVSDKMEKLLYEDCEALLAQDVLIENSFQDMYGEDIDSILESDLFVDSNYTSFENKDLRLVFLVAYFSSLKEKGKYITFVDFLEKRENGHSSQEAINNARITLALELPDVIQGNKILRTSM